MILVPAVSIGVASGGKEVHATCHQLLFEKRQLVVGLSNGTIALYRRRVDSYTLREQVDPKPILLHGHTGRVTRLLIVREEGQGADALLISASADRTVRIWDPSVREMEKACVQKLRGHGGTVNAVAMHLSLIHI